MDRLFAYGTLLAPELRARIVGRSLPGVPAVLRNYACWRVQRATYPAIVATPGATTRGEVFESLTAQEWDALDRFESRLYDRTRVTVTRDDGGPIEACTYVITLTARARLSDEPWDYTIFRQRHLQRYLQRL